MAASGKSNRARIPGGGGVKDSARTPARKRRRKRRLRFSLVLLVLLACAVFVVLSLTVLFRVSDFQVGGDLGTYTAQQLVDASGIRTETNLFAVDTAAAEAQIERELPYIQEAKVSIHLPDRVNIQVTQAQVSARLETDMGTVCVNRSCKVLGLAAEDDTAPLICNAQVSGAQPGSPAEFAREDTASVISALLDALENTSFGSVDSIDLTDLYMLTFQYSGLYTVKLGSTADLNQKLSFARYVIDQKLEPGQPGTLDLSVSTDQAIFRPDYGSNHVIVSPGAQNETSSAPVS